MKKEIITKVLERYKIEMVKDSLGIVIRISDNITGKEVELLTFRDEELPYIKWCPYCQNYYEVEDGHSCWEQRSGLVNLKPKGE